MDSKELQSKHLQIRRAAVLICDRQANSLSGPEKEFVKALKNAGYINSILPGVRDGYMAYQSERMQKVGDAVNYPTRPDTTILFHIYSLYINLRTLAASRQAA